MSGYHALHNAAFAEGALSVKTKELIALAISITRECDGCVAAHGRNLARRGATTEEVTEMIGVAISMNGGPGTVWGPRRWRPTWSSRTAERARRGLREVVAQRGATGVKRQSRCLMPLMNGERSRSGSPTASMSGSRSNRRRNITSIS